MYKKRNDVPRFFYQTLVLGFNSLSIANPAIFHVPRTFKNEIE
ncbi:hypothetical protein [Anaerorhabdus sp.]